MVGRGDPTEQTELQNNPKKKQEHFDMERSISVKLHRLAEKEEHTRAQHDEQACPDPGVEIAGQVWKLLAAHSEPEQA